MCPEEEEGRRSESPVPDTDEFSSCCHGIKEYKDNGVFSGSKECRRRGSQVMFCDKGTL